MTATFPSYASMAGKSRSDNKNNDVSPRQLLVSATYSSTIGLLSPSKSKSNKNNQKSTKRNSNNKNNKNKRNNKEITNNRQNQANSQRKSTPKRKIKTKRNKKSLQNKREQSLKIKNDCKYQLSSSIDHKQYKDLLITGYIRNHRNVKNISYFSKDLINLTLSFYDEITYWSIKNKQMKTFKSMQNGQVMYGPKFDLIPNEIQFETTLCPSGWKESQNGAVQFYIELKKLPEFISTITVYYELSCKETESHCKKIRIFRKVSDAQSWGTNNMRLSECEDFDDLQFASLVKILRVEYDEEYEDNNLMVMDFKKRVCFEKMQLNEVTYFQWDIKDELLKKLKCCETGKFYYSPNFGNDAFCFELAPNGWHSSNRGKLMLYLRLLRLPKEIKKVQCECEFKSNHQELVPIWRHQHTFCYGIHGLQWCLDKLSLKELILLNDLKLIVKIKIVKVFDVNGDIVDKEQWKEYDIY